MALYKLTIMPEFLHTSVIYSVKSNLPLEHILLHGNCSSLFINSILPATKYLIQWKGAQSKALLKHLFLCPMKRRKSGWIFKLLVNSYPFSIRKWTGNELELNYTALLAEATARFL